MGGGSVCSVDVLANQRRPARVLGGSRKCTNPALSLLLYRSADQKSISVLKAEALGGVSLWLVSVKPVTSRFLFLGVFLGLYQTWYNLLEISVFSKILSMFQE